MGPSILLADEPTGQPRHAPPARRSCGCSSGCTREGNTIILVTHERDIAEHAHRTIHIRDGQIESDDAEAP